MTEAPVSIVMYHAPQGSASLRLVSAGQPVDATTEAEIEACIAFGCKTVSITQDFMDQLNAEATALRDAASLWNIVTCPACGQEFEP